MADRVIELVNQERTSRGLQPQDEAAMVGYLYLFIAALMKETIAGKPHSTSSSSQYVLNAIKYIQFNYSHDISIDDVAKSVGVSRSHLYRVFMLNVGKSPIDYLTEYRINEACKLLRAGSLSIAEVAVSVGFFDQFYFSRVFKRAKGVPPSKYFAAQQDADPADPAAVPRQDLPMSFSPVHRQYGFRPVREWRLDRPEMPEPTEHDPMAELQN